jgi:hypothetical protein
MVRRTCRTFPFYRFFSAHKKINCTKDKGNINSNAMSIFSDCTPQERGTWMTTSPSLRRKILRMYSSLEVKWGKLYMTSHQYPACRLNDITMVYGSHAGGVIK